MCAFLACCAFGGALLTLLVARFMPLLIRWRKALLVLLVGLFALVVLQTLQTYEESTGGSNFIREAMGQLTFVRNPWLPPRWAQEGVSAALNVNWSHFWYCNGLLLITAATLAILGEWIAHYRVRQLFDGLSGRVERQRGVTKPWRLLPLIPRDLALLVAKDLRLFWRDRPGHAIRAFLACLVFICSSCFALARTT